LEKEIDERKIRESELRDSNQKLQGLDQMKTDFLSTISHEFRTPLTSILGFSKIINKKLKNVISPAIDESQKKIHRALLHATENMDIIIDEGEKLTYLINNILDIAKMEAGKVEWRMQSISLTEVIDKALSLMALIVEQRGLKIIKDYSNYEKYYVWGDFERLTQVVVNLLSNAIKFTQNGSITLKIIKKKRSLVVSIIDTGIGILENDIGQIFDKFIQVGDTLTNRPQGTGLGLAICKQVIEHHKGKIWVESIIGQGSNFSFSLPFVEGEWFEIW
jgi:signal transduction histidine kinase